MLSFWYLYNLRVYDNFVSVWLHSILLHSIPIQSIPYFTQCLFIPSATYYHLLSYLSPLTSVIVGALRIVTFPTFPVFHCPQGISKLYSCPFLDVTFPSLHLASSPSCSFHCPLQNCFRHARGFWDAAWSYHPSFFSLPRLGNHHALQLHSGFCCEPSRSSHGLFRKCSDVSYSISSQGFGSFSRVLLSKSSCHKHKGGWIKWASASA